MDAIRYITLFAEGQKRTGMQVLLVSVNMSGLPSISGEKNPKDCERICVLRHLNTFINTFILNGLNICLKQAGLQVGRGRLETFDS